MAFGRLSSSRKSPLKMRALGMIMALGIAAVVVQTAPGVTSALMPVRTQAGDLLAASPGREESREPGLLARIMGHGARERRIRELEARVQELARYEAAARSMAARLEAYESMLSAMGEPPARGATARVVSEVNGPFSETLLANAGRAQGVEPDAIALNEGGVVGRVTHLGERSSRILLVTDFNSRIPVMGENSGVRAIVFGDSDGLGTLADRPEEDPFLPGERILTSGEGGLFPRGYMVGAAQMREGRWRVAFSMSETRGGFVRLVPPQRIPTPEEAPAIHQSDPANAIPATETPDAEAAMETGGEG
ncbi:MAG: rod shape-determining protein MreC [Hyphomonadaceae bacterium]|nr:rod shape-determining protein MreC [Hyphomonadaceae bacterium]